MDLPKFRRPICVHLRLSVVNFKNSLSIIDVNNPFKDSLVFMWATKELSTLPRRRTTRVGKS
jgi:hypothetical protein